MSIKSDDIEISLQLEESNKTLTKDVENLSKEKAELNEKLNAQEGGTAPSVSLLFNKITLLYKQSLCLDRVCSSEGRDCKYNQGQLREGPQYRAHAEDSGKDPSFFYFRRYLQRVAGCVLFPT